MSKQARAVRSRLEDFGMEKFTVINTHIPALKALIVGDLAEDNVVLLNKPKDSKRYTSETRHLLGIDLDCQYAFAAHISPKRITRGEYGTRFIGSVLIYQQRLLDRVDQPEYLQKEMKDFIGEDRDDGLLLFISRIFMCIRQMLKKCTLC